MDAKKNYLGENSDRARNHFCVLLILVVFWGIGVTLLIAAIKLVGGFFYSREIYVERTIENNHNAAALKLAHFNFFSDFSKELGTKLFDSAAWLMCAVKFFLTITICAVILEVRNKIATGSFFKSDCLRIRSPIVLRILRVA
jgi:hypothetical protein